MSEALKLIPGLKLKHNGISCELDIMDWESNSPPAGFLWLRKLIIIPVIPGIEPVEGKGESIGMIHVVTGQTFNITHIRDCVPSIPSMPETIRLMNDIYFPKPLSLWKRFLNLFRKKM